MVSNSVRFFFNVHCFRNSARFDVQWWRNSAHLDVQCCRNSTWYGVQWCRKSARFDVQCCRNSARRGVHSVLQKLCRQKHPVLKKFYVLQGSVKFLNRYFSIIRKDIVEGPRIPTVSISFLFRLFPFFSDHSQNNGIVRPCLIYDDRWINFFKIRSI